jgi:anti-anti-sigma factor
MSVVYLHPTGIIDADVGNFLLNQIQSELNLGNTTFHLDCFEVSSIDEQGLERLLQAFKLIVETQGRLILFSTNESVRAFLAAHGLDIVLDIYP